MTRRQTDIAVFGNFSAHGGVERAFANMIRVWTELGYAVDVLGYRSATLLYPDYLSDSARFLHLGTEGKIATTYRLWRYIARERPRVVLASGHISNLIASFAAWLSSSYETRWYLNIQNDFVASGKDKTGRKQPRKLRQIRRWYRLADALLVTSEGLAQNLKQATDPTGIDVRVIHNGVITDELIESSKADVDHPWLTSERPVPVIVGAGRLQEQKDFHTLLRALAYLRQVLAARLVIIGEGKERQSLLDLAAELGIKDHTDLPGFMDNPYAWIARADIFALSSLWEGFGNVVAEALALGVPVVSTSCPSGPSDILAQGEYGRLVPPGDPEALARALADTLTHGNLCSDAKEASRTFMASYAARAYLEAFGLAPEADYPRG